MIEPDLLLRAYAAGWFPMGTGTAREVEWFSPDPRGVLPLDAFHIPSRVNRLVRRGAFEIRVNTAFDEVVTACAARAETWINPEIRESYARLHELGFAHSVEAWRGESLEGGLYGVSLRGAFFGESMFHRASGASKVALVALVDRLRDRGFALLDLQWVTPHLAQFGAVAVSRVEYLRRLEASLARHCRFD